jgi:hypothetical protein
MERLVFCQVIEAKGDLLQLNFLAIFQADQKFSQEAFVKVAGRNFDE